MRLGRKITGGKYHKFRKKKLHAKKTQERIVILGETKSKIIKTRGGNYKPILLTTNIANLTINGKTERAKIINVLETPQNSFFARQNRLNKGVIIETDKGKAKITNRPSQEGQINAIILEK